MSLLPVHWYYNTESGQLTQGNNLENLGNNLVGGAGWHELNIPGSDTQAQAAAAAKSEFPTGTAPTTAGISPASIAKSAASSAGNAAKNALGSVLGSWTIGGVSGTNLVIRAAKIIIGALLLTVGLVHITGAGGAAASVARKVPLPV